MVCIVKNNTIICGRQPRKTQCSVCGKVQAVNAIRQCDFKAYGRTCNKFLCTDCTVRVGRFFDFCPDHPR